MERAWPDETIDFEAAVAGGASSPWRTDFARRCKAEPSVRRGELHGVLEGLGLLDLNANGSAAEAAASARAMLAAGSVVCPWPLVQQLSVPVSLSRRGERRIPI